MQLADLNNVMIQLFQLRLSDQLKLTRQDRRVVWVVANQSCSFTVVRTEFVRNFEFPGASNK